MADTSMITQEWLNSIMRKPGETNRREPAKLPFCPNCGERYCGDGIQRCVECLAMESEQK